MARIGRLRKKVAELLSHECGHAIEPENVVPVTGFWKSEDVYRWEVCQPVSENRVVMLGCWTSMADFVRDARNGITFSDLYGNCVDPKDYWHSMEVHAESCD